MTDPSGDPSQHPRILARAKIAKALEATSTIDRDLWGLIDGLQQAGRVGNGAGIYADIPLLRVALSEAASAIARAQKIVRETDWPTDEDYDVA